MRREKQHNESGKCDLRISGVENYFGLVLFNFLNYLINIGSKLTFRLFTKIYFKFIIFTIL